MTANRKESHCEPRSLKAACRVLSRAASDLIIATFTDDRELDSLRPVGMTMHFRTDVEDRHRSRNPIRHSSNALAKVRVSARAEVKIGGTIPRPLIVRAFMRSRLFAAKEVRPLQQHLTRAYHDSRCEVANECSDGSQRWESGCTGQDPSNTSVRAPEASSTPMR